MHGKIYKYTEKIFFRVFGNTRKKKNSVYLEIHGKIFRVLKKIPCVQKISVYFKYMEIFSVYCEKYTEIFWIHGIFFNARKTLTRWTDPQSFVFDPRNTVQGSACHADVEYFAILATRVENFSKIRSSPVNASSHEQRLQHDRSTHDDKQRTFREWYFDFCTIHQIPFEIVIRHQTWYVEVCRVPKTNHPKNWWLFGLRD